MFRPQTTNLTCPKCRANYAALIFNIIDVGQTPELKQIVLSDALNASQCPNCGNINYVATPLLYHDPEHEFLAVFMPPQLNMSESQRQRAIGDLTNTLMKGLPAEQRRGYMLNPQPFLTMQSLTERLLGFEGITPEMIAASRRKMELVGELLRLRNDNLAFLSVVKENENLLDDEFFRLLTNIGMSVRAQGQMAEFEAFAEVQEKLLPLTEAGHRIQKQRQAVNNLGDRPTPAAVLEAIIAADLDEVEAITFAARPLLDYQFFQTFTARIESASGEARAALEAKRQLMLRILEDLRAAEREAAQEAQQVLQALLSAENMQEAVEENLPLIDQNVMSYLMMNIEEAAQRGAVAAVERLRELLEIITAALEASLPPEVALFLKLLSAEYPNGTRALLREHKSGLTPEFFAYFEGNLNKAEEEAQTDPDRKAMARHLRNVLTQARLER